MKKIKGISVALGISCARAFVYSGRYLHVSCKSIKAKQIPHEMERLYVAVQKVSNEIALLSNSIDGTDDTIAGLGDVLNAHQLMIQDPHFHTRVEAYIQENLVNVEFAVQKVIGSLIEQLKKSDTRYLRDRADDMEDIAQHLQAVLLGKDADTLKLPDKDIILVAHNLLTSDLFRFDRKNIKGIALDAGGRTSHTAILARSYGIPTVVGLKTMMDSIYPTAKVIIDGNIGEIIISPTIKVLRQYAELKDIWQQYASALGNYATRQAKTTDGVTIPVMANIEYFEAVHPDILNIVNGIGLFRSEFLFLQPHNPPDEEEQYRAYSYVLKNCSDAPVTIRTLDMGGAQVLSNDTPYSKEDNPLLGWRAIRFCLHDQEIFKTQLRALLRASVEGNLQILFPMISGVEEIKQTFAIIDEIKEELREANIPFSSDIPFGAMIEVPSAALTADIIAQQVDFLSIGTNDLIQYTIAVDRSNERIADLYNPLHPAMLRLLQKIIEDGHNAQIPVTLCGEMASDPLMTLLLIGLGIDSLSMALTSVPGIKKVINELSMTEAREFVAEIMQMEVGSDINRYVYAHMQKRFGIFDYT